MLRLLGYSDRLNAGPGDTVKFMVSCDYDDYETRLVRLIHGDTNPAGPGFRQEVVPSSIDGRRPGRRESIHTGSYARVELPAPPADRPGFTFATFLQPTNPAVGEQVIASRGTPYEGGPGWALALDDDGCLEAVIGQGGVPQRHRISPPLSRWHWYHVGVSLAGAQITAWCRPVRQLPGAVLVPHRVFAVSGGEPRTEAPLLLAATADGNGATARHLDGRLDRPRLLDRVVAADDIEQLVTDPDAVIADPDVVAAWDLSRDVHTDLMYDASRHGRHGRLVNMPTRAVTGYNHTGGETDFRLAPAEYGAVHFHRDDLDDAGWPVQFEFTVPADLPSGIYAAWLRAGEDEDHIPFVVRPSSGVAHSRIAVLISTMSYLVYENFTDLGKGVWREDSGFVGNGLTHPLADPSLFREVFEYIDENSLYGPYDVHADGSGVCYASQLKPILNLRPKFRYRTMGVPVRLGADLYLVDWLEQRGIQVDYLTDHDLHAEGAALLERYHVVISSSHHEYWTTAMMDGLSAYLEGGGRLMYLGGNSFYGVVSVDPHRPHVVEVRRWGTSWPFESPPAERRHSTTGEQGGTWRNRGRGPHALVGMGTAGAGFDRGSPYQRMPDSHDPRVQFVFAGLGADELIGDVPSLQVRWGAAGYEFDRVDTELGSPATTLVLASSNRFNQSHRAMLDDQLWYVQGRDGASTADPQVPGRPHRFARSDMAYLEYPAGGAVFAAGAICWRACLSAHGYDNSVSRVTENVLRRFAETPRGDSPSDPVDPTTTPDSA
ncbi:N,N-dimethylformamidase [Micromonospora sp. HB375]|uniref:N,N-dimethylformamidase beta subunit family domain-containing protein n=1 Tax=unclassified Micromonospora TaxID=2617518 RepID=UPI001AE2D504|nr:MULTISPECIES: N,N-dimethylformamidase beta subunit family domain-containing protein [unclassified Micromonospora]MBP1782056.1 N,N-dimethylformamidase [Micromonospora sp. HB375]MDH6470869.1 N,N-dimethylformamidase [Micromonospora sp. H404/HB375]